ncbi:hypothetical protein NX794_21105 [Streptomyces sp. LP11]|uniref:DNA mismatch repair proteins mutS family domain-containing protein n=1 Tax=Streptomyces pyxinicus TaxID=2970331 RepID=A0ABT2B5A7_9ACTN|nr:hypothetical protein [Streptomyces sp. LP11]MCS0603694.1 hypothetical protein [Streptomyces sp. LP11]
MKARLLYADRDLDWDAPPVPEAADLTRDLALDTLFDAMADGDDFLRDTARQVVLTSLTEPDAIVYRQRILGDFLRRPGLLTEMYRLVVETIDAEHRIWPTFLRSPTSIMHRAVQAMELYAGRLRELRRIADRYADDVRSPGLVRFLGMLRAELDDACFDVMDEHLRRLRFRNGVMVGARLGQGCKGTGYVLRRPGPRPSWRERLAGQGPPSYTYRLPDRDEAGARALAELRDRGVALAADALARSADHILGFLRMLDRELGFYLACLNLHRKLTAKGEPLCVPTPLPTGRPTLVCHGLYDTCLSLRREERVVGNDVDAEDTALLVVTGANEGGKTTFLRSVGLAQLMTQAGMFVSADSFTAGVRTRLFTHFRREEDEEMESGKLDEELARMSAIADEVTPGALVLFNESFAATNEREGSELGRQITGALLDCGVKVVLVTHLYGLAHGLYAGPPEGKAVFLRAERRADGTRTHRLVPGEPLPTSFGADLYRNVFGEPARTAAGPAPDPPAESPRDAPAPAASDLCPSPDVESSGVRDVTK